MQTIPENELQIKNDIGTAGYVRTVGTDGKSFRTGIKPLVEGALGGDLLQIYVEGTSLIINGGIPDGEDVEF